MNGRNMNDPFSRSLTHFSAHVDRCCVGYKGKYNQHPFPFSLDYISLPCFVKNHHSDTIEENEKKQETIVIVSFLMMIAKKQEFVCILLPLFILPWVQALRTIRLGTLTGWRFHCASSTCPPFLLTTTSTLDECKRRCLCDVRCQALTFQVSISSCALFNDVPSPARNMNLDGDMITLLIINGSSISTGE
jgi:hypothetical protein